MLRVLLLLPLLVFGMDRAVLGQEPAPSPLDVSLQSLADVDWGPDRQKLVPIDQAIAASFELESRLLPILSAPQTTLAAKSYICRKLKQVGTESSVPALAKLLKDPELAHFARRALESIPGDQSATALRDALGGLTGDLRLGVIDSLGRLGDIGSTAQLCELLDDSDAATTNAALLALANIDSPEAVRAVLGYQQLASDQTKRIADDACLRIAQRMQKNGALRDAAAVYAAIDLGDDHRLALAVLRGRLLAEPTRAVDLILATLDSGDDRLSRSAAEHAREFASPEQAKSLVLAIPTLKPGSKALLLDALGERSIPEVRQAALALLSAEDEEIRITAIRALRNSGKAEDARALASVAASGDTRCRREIVATLSRLGGADVLGSDARNADVDEALWSLLPESEPAVQVVLIGALRDRGNPAAVNALLDAAQQGGAQEVQLAALGALEGLASSEAIDPLVELLSSSSEGKVRDATDRALWITCLKSLDADRQAEPLIDALNTASSNQRAAILPCLGRLGGERALEVVHAAMSDADPAVRSAAVQALTNWPDDKVADEMWDIAENSDQSSHRIWALRGFARVIARRGRAEPQLTSDRLIAAMQLAERVEEKRLILSRLTAARVPASLDLAMSYVDDAELGPAAIESAAALGEAMKDTHPAEARAALEKVAKVTPDTDLQLCIAKLLWNMSIKGN